MGLFSTPLPLLILYPPMLALATFDLSSKHYYKALIQVRMISLICIKEC
ncbi:hypothetical protein BH11PAT1_BH11PAT1_2810 [soil metagenome]